MFTRLVRALLVLLLLNGALFAAVSGLLISLRRRFAAKISATVGAFFAPSVAFA